MLIKLLKYFFYALASVIALAVISVFSYLGYENYRTSKALAYRAASKCVMHQSETQLCEPIGDSRRSFLRRVNLDTGEVVISWMADDAEFKYGYEVFWPARCQPGDEIETDIQLSNGTAKFYCIDESLFFNTEGESYISMKIRAKEKSDLDYSYGGFSVSEFFSFTDYSALEREVTLDSAKSAAQIALEEEAAREEERLKNIALEKERADAAERALAIIEKEREDVAQSQRLAAEREAAARLRMRECEDANLEKIALLKAQYISQLETEAKIKSCDFYYNTCRLSIWNRTAHPVSSIQLGVTEAVGSGPLPPFCPTLAPTTTLAVEIPPNDTAELTIPSNGVIGPLGACIVVVSAEFVEIESGLERCEM